MTNEQCWAHLPNPDDPTGPFVACTNSGEPYKNKHNGKEMYVCAEHIPSRSWVPALNDRRAEQLLTGQEP